MKEEKLSNIVNIVLGKNGSRIQQPKSKIYNVEHMNADLENLYQLANNNHSSNDSNAGNVVFNLNTYQTAVISVANTDKVLDQNFMLLKCNDKVVDPRYLCFILNNSNSIKRQESAMSQGLIVRRLSTNDIKRMQIPLVSLPQQKLIGQIYAMQIHYQWLTEQRMNLVSKSLEQIMKSLIETRKEF